MGVAAAPAFFFTIIGFYASFHGSIAAILATAFFGLCALIAGAQLLPGASSLRLDEDGFEFTRFFRTSEFLWSDVDDFHSWGSISGWRTLFFGFYSRPTIVVFKVKKPRLSISEKINSALAGGNGYLPDTYGMAAEDLSQLMNAWRSLATSRPK